MLAGIQIQFGVYPSSYYVCTLGFNVYKLIGSSVDSTQRYFLTNSHCSQVRFAFDGGPYWQPDYYITTPADSIGSEVQDPPLFTGSPCPSGKQCRWSDVALIKYRSTTTWFHGGVAASTATQPPGPAPWNGWWTFHTNNSGQVNQTVYYKTGRTTGTTSGPLARTCYDFPFDGVQSGIILKCQYRVSAAGGGQDSGSPVYLPDYWAGFYALWPWGILHSADASQFVFSSTNGIAQDLGMNFYYLTNCGLIDPPICGS